MRWVANALERDNPWLQSFEVGHYFQRAQAGKVIVWPKARDFPVRGSSYALVEESIIKYRRSLRSNLLPQITTTFKS
jgi:hypothetical protein